MTTVGVVMHLDPSWIGYEGNSEDVPRSRLRSLAELSAAVENKRPIRPAPLSYDWPIFNRERTFVLGRLLDCPAVQIRQRASGVGSHQGVIGRWECDLGHNALTWTNEVYDIFGLPRGERVSRDEAVSLYCEHSRAVMERLRAHAIEQKQGFVLDAEIRPGHGKRRWMRLIAFPVCDADRVVRLHGSKQII